MLFRSEGESSEDEGEGGLALYQPAGQEDGSDWESQREILTGPSALLQRFRSRMDEERAFQATVAGSDVKEATNVTHRGTVAGSDVKEATNVTHRGTVAGSDVKEATNVTQRGTVADSDAKESSHSPTSELGVVTEIGRAHV